MGYQKISFPCGLEFVSSGWFESLNKEDVGALYVKGCPLHSHDCKK